MKEQTNHFDQRVFESVSSDWFDSYKITSSLVKITEASEKSSGRLVGGLVVNDTINYTINDTTNLLSGNERTVFEEMRMRLEITAHELSDILNINLRNTKTIIWKLKEKGLVERMGSRKTGHWEVV